MKRLKKKKKIADKTDKTTRRNKSRLLTKEKKHSKDTGIGSSNTNKTGLFNITKENPTNKSVEKAQVHSNNWMKRKQNCFGA